MPLLVICLNSSTTLWSQGDAVSSPNRPPAQGLFGVGISGNGVEGGEASTCPAAATGRPGLRDEAPERQRLPLQQGSENGEHALAETAEQARTCGVPGALTRHVQHREVRDPAGWPRVVPPDAGDKSGGPPGGPLRPRMGLSAGGKGTSAAREEGHEQSDRGDLGGRQPSSLPQHRSSVARAHG